MHILILNRWNDIFTDYENYFDHKIHQISYLTSEVSVKVVNQDKAHMVKVLKNYDCTQTAIRAASIIHMTSPIDKVVAFSEYDMDKAAYIREALSISGPNIEANKLFRDKARMKEVLSPYLRVPRFKKVSSKDEVIEFLQTVSLPAVLKPTLGAASERVEIIDCLDKLKSLEVFDGDEIEEFIEGQIYHIDGIRSQDDFAYLKISKYYNNCLMFRNGSPLGSVSEDSPNILKDVTDFTIKTLDVLGLNEGAFHLELIANSKGFYFLEIGARIGGGEIPFIAKSIEGVDLYKLWASVIQEDKVCKVEPKITGFLMIPNPHNGNYKITNNNNIQHENLVNQIIIPTGFSDEFSYEKIPGRFHFRGKSSQAIESSIKDVCAIFIPRIHTS